MSDMRVTIKAYCVEKCNVEVDIRDCWVSIGEAELITDHPHPINLKPRMVQALRANGAQTIEEEIEKIRKEGN